MRQSDSCHQSAENSIEFVMATITRMGDTLRETTACNGSCTAEDLINAGFTSTEIIEHIEDAREYAILRASQEELINAFC
ncbi:hypothetical protein [Pseudochelatococcus sp. G4_1912]|uniref:hypothetical protein n=1 Tax=Pseudochelatococcus sp. G4_1912 TaxID=3114288 RepID=UPI0039C75EE2